MGNYHHSHSGIQHHSLHPIDPNPYFQHIPLRAIGGSPAESPFSHFSSQRTGSPLTGLSQSPVSGQSVGHSPSPKSFVEPTGSSPKDYAYQHLHDRFPFSGTETYSAAAIRG
jgi:hypothetical protein